MDQFGFLRVAAAVPQIKVGDCAHNAKAIEAMIQQATLQGVEILCLPELCIVGATCGDLFLQSTLLESADMALAKLVKSTRKLPIAAIVGAPLRHGAALYNCAVVFAQGRVLGVVPKSYIDPTQSRWFTSGAQMGDETINVAGDQADFGADLSFEINGAEFAIEIGEDLLAPTPPSTQLALNGAQVIFCLAAMAEEAGKQQYTETTIAMQSARTHSAYVYASAGGGESSTDLVFAGCGLVAEDGSILSRNERLTLGSKIAVADVDIELLNFKRRGDSLLRVNASATENTVIEMELPEPMRSAKLIREVEAMPFVPSEPSQCAQHCREVFEIQALGLAQRLSHTGCKRAIIGISGGLDSTLALLVTARSFDLLGLKRKGIIGITMPGFGTSDRTYNNALKMISAMGITQREISIKKACEEHFAAIGLKIDDRGAAYENAQARERTQILMDIANMECGLVVGTGDMSELALGWATYNGDHMSMYGVNAAVPKTLVREIVSWAANEQTDNGVREMLLDVVATPVSPELLPADCDGNIAQCTEDLVGPYVLHDFFLYNFMRNGYGPEKLLRLAEQAFEGQQDRATILKWLNVFFRRFFSQQFKRSAMPDGPKVGALSLSPRGGWAMPSDGSAAAWIAELDSIK